MVVSMKSTIGLLAALATALVLSSCSSPAPAPDGHEHGSESSASAQPAQNNAADVTFATDMIPHHQQAVAMSGLVPGRSTDPAVVALAAEIAAAQGPEVGTMKGFLAQWNVGADASHDEHQGADGMPMQGMVDDATMARLKSLTGDEFDALWLSSMIGHHEGAIAMANTEIADGVNADAKALAQQIVTTQQSEIERMKKMGPDQ